MATLEPGKLLVVGWEGADWKVIGPLLDAGRLPNLARLVEEGVMGKLATLEPQITKPLWTSIATGHSADRHGVLGELEPDPAGVGLRATGSHCRRKKAIWQLCTEHGLRSLVVGWPGTHPAELVDGVVVSELFARVGGAPVEVWPLAPGTVQPPERSEELAELRVHPVDLGIEHVLPLVPGAADLDPRHAPVLAEIRTLLAETTSVHAAMCRLLEDEPWDLAAVCYDAIDRASHAFMPMRAPRMPGVSREAFEAYRHVVDGVYVYCDLMLGRLLELTGPEARVVLLSEHGFRSGDQRPGPGAPGKPDEAWRSIGRRSDLAWHREIGVLAMRGEGLRRDEWVWGADLLSVMPTLLALLGLPVADDLPGRGIWEAFEERPEIERAPGSGPATRECVVEAPGTVPGAAEQLARLVEQGWIEAAGLDDPGAAEGLREEAELQRALACLQAGRPGDALPILQALHRRRPTLRRYLLHLARCHERLGDIAEARCVIEEFDTLGRPNAVSSMIRARLDLAEGRLDDALCRLFEAEQANPDRPLLHCQIGDVYLRMERWREAEEAFRRALAVDPDAAEAHLGLTTAALHGERNEQAAESALAAITCRHRLPAAHYLLGVALAKLGRGDEAIFALETALRQKPDLREAHRVLSQLHERVTGDLARAALHRAQAEAEPGASDPARPG
jgi:tetratricopeptide (TPR) repeat protein